MKKGRPVKSKVKSNKANKTYKSYNEPDDYVPPKTYDFLGYCPKASCGTMIMSLDLDTKTIFKCPVCGKRARISKLKQEREIKDNKIRYKMTY